MASRISKTSPIFTPKYFVLESSRNLLGNIPLYIVFTILSKKTLEPLTTWDEPKWAQDEPECTKMERFVTPSHSGGAAMYRPPILRRLAPSSKKQRRTAAPSAKKALPSLSGGPSTQAPDCKAPRGAASLIQRGAFASVTAPEKSRFAYVTAPRKALFCASNPAPKSRMPRWRAQRCLGTRVKDSKSEAIYMCFSLVH